MQKDYLHLAQKIIIRHKLQSYVDLLLDYWAENPTTLGHGFSHVLEVAVEAYEIAKLNNYPQPEHLFIGGLFHDIYRPAEGKGGNEDQTLGAKITKDLFDKNKVPEEITQKIYAALISHDDWRGEKQVSIFDLLLSTGDKAAHDFTVTYGYIWASNKFAKDKGEKPFFTNHLHDLYLFMQYQMRAWEVFMKHPIKGTERAIAKYLNIYQTTADNYLKDKQAKKFFAYVDKIAEQVRTKEIKYLKFFKVPDAKIKKLMQRFY